MPIRRPPGCGILTTWTALVAEAKRAGLVRRRERIEGVLAAGAAGVPTSARALRAAWGREP